MKFYYFYEGIDEEVEVTSIDKNTIHVNHRLGPFVLKDSQFEFIENCLYITGYQEIEKDKFVKSTLKFRRDK